ncbi:hypothetical protein GCM10022281_09030 [Sphingomonas rosea]|uniref:Cell division transport system permease protein n=2 Tax=Sphingomonas rosea TaxID=335605 RepID=A0ABP7TUZ9_9SPHN
MPPPAMRRLLPEQRRRSAPWIVGLMTFVSLIVGAAGVAVIAGVSDLRADAANRWSLQVTGTPSDALRAQALLRGDPAVASLTPVPEADLRRTLRQWLGPAADALDLPLPSLADVTLRDGAAGAALATRVESVVPSARLTSYGAELRPLLATLQGLAALAAGLLLVLAGALAAAVTLAARSSLDTNRATLEVLHGVGATDQQLLAIVQRRIALDALIGSLAGAAAATLILLLALIPARGLLAGWSGGAALPLGGIALLALLPLAQALLATAVARRALRQSLAGTL